MRVHERMRVARQAYAQAVATARADSSPATWRRLLAASKNLRLALRDHDRAGRGGSTARHPRAPAAAASGPTHRATQGTVVLPDARPAPPETTSWAALHREIERARALVAWSRRLVAESRTLRTALSDAAARIPASPAPAGDPA